MAESGENRKLRPREILPGIVVLRNPADVARAGTRLFVDWAWQAIAKDGHFNVALSGGSTPRDMYRLLATPEYRAQVDWPRVHLFWGDERAVPPDDPDSNYAMVRRELLLRVPIPPANVHRMEAEDPIIGRAAHAYEKVLRRFLPLNGRGFPVFHLIMLGMGPDGHTASLFPGSPFLSETSHWVSTPLAPKLNMRRMTLTLPVLRSAERVLFLVTGSDKSARLREILSPPGPNPLPAQMAVPHDGDRVFLIDDAAAGLLYDLPAAAPSAQGGNATPPQGNS